MNYATPAIAVIEKIYTYYESWADAELNLACHQGCAVCCTRNVTMTRTEGEIILSGLQQEASGLQWLTDKLPVAGPIGRPGMSTNQWATHCFTSGEIGETSETRVFSPCPFLAPHKSCSIYPLRSFSCRCFASSIDCAESGTAEQPDLLMEVNTATMQIIEHLGRGRWWGNMLDILYALTLLEDIQEDTNKRHLQETIKHLHMAGPLPGFLIMTEQQEAVQSYLDGLFAVQVDDKTTIGEMLQIS